MKRSRNGKTATINLNMTRTRTIWKERRDDMGMINKNKHDHIMEKIS